MSDTIINFALLLVGLILSLIVMQRAKNAIDAAKDEDE